jgi:hypothetical protein
MSIGTIVLIILVIALLGGFSGIGGGPFYGTGYYGGGRPRVGGSHSHNPIANGSIVIIPKEAPF